MPSPNDLISARESAASQSAGVLLIVGEDDQAQRIERTLETEMEALNLSRVATLSEGYTALAEDPFDLVLVKHTLPDGTSLDLLSHIEQAIHKVSILVVMEAEEEAEAVAVMRAGAADYVRRVDDPSYVKELAIKVKQVLHRHFLHQQVRQLEREREQMKILDTVRTTVATVKHEINNPLAIISGNAQLLLELTRAMKLSDDLVHPIEDIEEASQRIAESLDKLGNLKEFITRRYVEGDSGVIELGEE